MYKTFFKCKKFNQSLSNWQVMNACQCVKIFLDADLFNIDENASWLYETFSYDSNYDSYDSDYPISSDGSIDNSNDENCFFRMSRISPTAPIHLA